MKKRIRILTLCAMLLPLSFPAEAQQTKKLPRIGYLTTAFAAEVTGRVDALRQGLRELGYLEGKNIIIEYRYARGRVIGSRRGTTQLISKRCSRRPRLWAWSFITLRSEVLTI